MAESETRRAHRFGKAEAQAFISLAIVLAIMIAAMFGAAGTWDWPRGWTFFGAYCALTFIACVWLWIANPELFAARAKMQAGTKGWDKILTVVLIFSYFTIFPISALDDARFRWAPQPDSVVIFGHVLFAAGFLGFTWASSVNRNFEATVRIQTDRGHKVVDKGPYAVVRHPGYIFAILMTIGMPLAMGSLYGLIPAAAMVVMVLIRTLAEDATLKAELPGYKDYAARVKHRWIPGVF
ncbi:MAG TPA: isoprenylcysteine carboxylmethyltransferase family protein [Hyphomonadaceae bacterium]|nr:isoprenylcysteine carboxylmethyltransferase family protein [Hyphomonadaceae bacterium]